MDLRYSKCVIKTHNMRWVKKHCTYQVIGDGTGEYRLENHEGVLFTPNMNREICNKTYTVVSDREVFIDVKKTCYSIPRWLLTEKESKEVVRMTDIKEQAIKHWKDNLKRVKAMNWKEWKHAAPTTRREVVFSTVGDKYPHISGEACPYCVRYHGRCRTADDTERCPLKQEFSLGGCCAAWLNVREALIVPWSKVQTVMAIKAMIEYIKERG